LACSAFVVHLCDAKLVIDQPVQCGEQFGEN